MPPILTEKLIGANLLNYQIKLKFLWHGIAMPVVELGLAGFVGMQRSNHFAVGFQFVSYIGLQLGKHVQRRAFGLR